MLTVSSQDHHVSGARWPVAATTAATETGERMLALVASASRAAVLMPTGDHTVRLLVAKQQQGERDKVKDFGSGFSELLMTNQILSIK